MGPWDRLNADWKWKVYDYVARALPQLGGPVIRRFSLPSVDDYSIEGNLIEIVYSDSQTKSHRSLTRQEIG